MVPDGLFYWGHGYVGIQTGTTNGTPNPPQKPLHIDSYYNEYGDQCPDPAIRLSYREQGNSFWGHLALISPINNIGFQYSNIAGTGDILLQADNNANDIVLTTKNSTGYLRFATTPSLPGPDLERMTIKPDGKVGIGINEPLGKFDVNVYNQRTRIIFDNNNGFPSLKLYRSATEPPQTNSLGWIIENRSHNGVSNGGLYFSLTNPTDLSQGQYGTQETKVIFHENGMVCAKEVRVSLSGSTCWPDNVFNDDYKLISIEELEKQIKQQKHLPDISTASEVENNGIELGDMQARLLKKIEELTFYIIEINKKNNQLQFEIEDLKNTISQISEGSKQ